VKPKYDAGQNYDMINALREILGLDPIPGTRRPKRHGFGTAEINGESVTIFAEERRFLLENRASLDRRS